MRRVASIRLIFGCIALAVLSGCSLPYYWQAAAGHMEVMRLRRPLAEVIADPATAAPTRRQLVLASEARDFAHARLGLPDNGSYRAYAALDRPYVVWNVFAAPELSLEPRQWCFPVAGCVPYRGYFSASRAREFAASLDRKGDDVFVGGVAAYSTLGRFDDPLLDTMLNGDEAGLASVIFHELAHQRVYVAGDAVFNESFATFVERQGLAEFLGARGDADAASTQAARLRDRARVLSLLAAARVRLAAVYAGDAEPERKRAGKARELGELRDAFAHLVEQSPGAAAYAGWFGDALNNATLVALATYEDRVAAFAQLFASTRGDWAAFYAEVERLAELPLEARSAALAGLMPDLNASVPAAPVCRAPAAASPQAGA